MKVISFIYAALMVFMVGYSAMVSAEGGNVRQGNPVFDDDGNIVGVVDPNVDCEKYFTAQSGAAVYFCVAEDDDD